MSLRNVVYASLFALAIDTAALGVPIQAAESNRALPFVVHDVVKAADQPAAPVVLAYRHPHQEVQRWYRTSLAAGWTEDQWRKLSCIIWRESGGQPKRYNPERHVGTRSNWGSYGLTQLYARANRDWLFPYVSRDLRLLFNPYINLRAARKLYLMRGWAPWASKSKPC